MFVVVRAGDGVHQRREHRVLRWGHPYADGRPEGPAAHHHARRATPAQQDIRQGTPSSLPPQQGPRYSIGHFKGCPQIPNLT